MRQQKHDANSAQVFKEGSEEGLREKSEEGNICWAADGRREKGRMPRDVDNDATGVLYVLDNLQTSRKRGPRDVISGVQT
jgi:hypothetical protein